MTRGQSRMRTSGIFVLQFVQVATGDRCWSLLSGAVECGWVRAKCLIYFSLREWRGLPKRWDVIENPRVGGSIPPQATKTSCRFP